ncbi:lytic transglycosylase domain-containing protein [Morganella morganii]|nr:lytic transglycosylase domain-containing protein [Morganella morganii]
MRRRVVKGIILFLIALPAMSREVPQGYRDVAQRENVPAEALYSLALTESSWKLPKERPQGGEVHPWPWTLNVAGRSYRYASRREAWQALQVFLRTTSPKRIDVGIAQVNLGWNGHYFRSGWEAFEPYTNLHVAAKILRACYDANPGSWMTAAGCYHHPAGGQPAIRYKGIVRRQLATLTPETHPVSLRVPGNTAVSPAVFVWVEPAQLNGE